MANRVIDLVLSDIDGDRWVYIGGERYALVGDVAKGPAYARDWFFTRAQIDKRYSPITVEFSEVVE